MSQLNMTPQANKPKSNGLALFIIFIVLTMGIYVVIEGIPDSTTEEKVVATEPSSVNEEAKTSSSQAEQGKYKEIPLTYGAALVTQDGQAYYWGYKDVVYAVNDVAKTRDKTLKEAPPSISKSLIDDAFKGKKLPPVAVFETTPEELMERINADMVVKKVPEFKKIAYGIYKIEDGQITIKEQYDHVATVKLEIGMKDEELMRSVVNTVSDIFTLSDDPVLIQNTFNKLNKVWNEPGKKFSATLSWVKFSLILEGDLLTLDIERG